MQTHRAAIPYPHCDGALWLLHHPFDEPWRQDDVKTVLIRSAGCAVCPHEASSYIHYGRGRAPDPPTARPSKRRTRPAWIESSNTEPSLYLKAILALTRAERRIAFFAVMLTNPDGRTTGMVYWHAHESTMDGAIAVHITVRGPRPYISGLQMDRAGSAAEQRSC